MRTLLVRGLTMAISSLLAGGCALAQTQASSSVSTSTNEAPQRRGATALSALPLGFEPNRGQNAAAVQFVAHTPEATIYLTGADAVLETSKFTEHAHGEVKFEPSSIVRMHLLGAAANASGIPGETLGGTVNYMRGNDPSKWQTNLPRYRDISLANVYPGVGLRYYGNGSSLEYDFSVAPNADAAAIRLGFEGGLPKIDDHGELLLTRATASTMRFARPVAYQEIDGAREPIQVAYRIAEDGTVSFLIGSYDHSRKLVIDPTLVYDGTLGTGIQQVNLSGMTVDSTGALYMIGTTNDSTFPVTANAYQKVCGPTKGNNGQVTYDGGYCPSTGGGESAAWITKLSADGTKLIYSTYLSGQSGTEQGIGITVDAAGIAYLLGTTGSNDFPITPDAYQKQCYAYYGVFGGPNVVQCDGYYNGGGTEYTIANQNAFFTKLSADGSSLLYSSFLGGTLPVYPNTIALDSAGNIYLSGQVAFLGPSLAPCANGYNQGCQPNTQFPGITTTGYMTVDGAINQYGNATDINAAAFLSKFTNDGHTLLYGTFLADNVRGESVLPTTMAVGVNGVAFLGGYTLATNYPTTAGAIKGACAAVNPGYNNVDCYTYDGYVAAIDTTKAGAASLVYSTRLGGTATIQGSNTPDQKVLGIYADSSNNAFVTGYTYESTFPVGTGGYQSSCPNNTGNIAPTDSGYTDRCDSAFLLKVDPTGTKILNGTFFAAPYLRSPETIGYAVKQDSRGNVLMYGTGNNYGYGYPFLNPLQTDNQPSTMLAITAFSSDLHNLLFATLFGNATHIDHNQNVAGGIALDPQDNVYFTGDTVDTDFATTAGTYATAQTTGAGHHPFFVKMSKVLQPTSTTLTAPATAVTGKSFTLKAVVAGVYQASPVATGTVTFTALTGTTSTTLGTASLDATGTATTTVTAPAVGTYTVTASYGADGTYDTSTSTATTLTVTTPVTPTIALTASATSGKPDTKFTFTAMLSSSSGTPTGTVTFLDGTTMLGTGMLSNGAASYAGTFKAGNHNITATYSGDSTFNTVTSTAQSIAVTAYSPNIALTSSATSASSGLSVTFTATLSATGTSLVPTGTVTFLDGSTTLGTGTVANGFTTYATSSLSAAVHSITAQYSGDANFAMATSSPFTETIAAATVSLTASPTSLTVTRGQSGTVTITATPVGVYSGTVTFSCGAAIAHTMCTFAPSTLTFNGSSSAQTSTLTLATNTAALVRPKLPGQQRGPSEAVEAGVFGFLSLLLLAGCTSARRRMHGALLILVIEASVLSLATIGCSGSANTGASSSTTSSSNTTAPGSYTLPVTATVSGTGSTSATLNLTVVVQ